jgi:hypothetical protein
MCVLNAIKKTNMCSNFPFSRYLNAIQTNAHHLLRYLATAVVVNKRRRNMLKDLIKVVQQEQHCYVSHHLVMLVHFKGTVIIFLCLITGCITSCVVMPASLGYTEWSFSGKAHRRRKFHHCSLETRVPWKCWYACFRSLLPHTSAHWHSVGFQSFHLKKKEAAKSKGHVSIHFYLA